MQISSLTKLPNIVKCPTSKSVANRMIILAALKRDVVSINDVPMSQDTQDLIRILQRVGVQITYDTDEVIIHNSFPECETLVDDPIVIEGSEGGTTIRFLLPFLALGKNEYHLTLKGKLSQRPFQECFNLLQSKNVKCSIQNEVLYIKGAMSLDGQFDLDCSRTTQFASAFVLLQIKYNLDLNFLNVNFSQKYLELTKELKNKLSRDNKNTVTVDFSSLGYFIAYALVKQTLQIENVNEIDPYQADSYFFELMNLLNLKYELTSDKGLFIQKANIIPCFNIDSSKCIDLVPTLMFLASFAQGESSFTNLQFLRDKECDRLEEMKRILTFFNVPFVFNLDNHTLVITGSGGQGLTPKEETYTTEPDHRMVMIVSLFYKCLKDGEVHPSHAVKKSFPNFFDYFS